MELYSVVSYLQVHVSLYLEQCRAKQMREHEQRSIPWDTEVEQHRIHHK